MEKKVDNLNLGCCCKRLRCDYDKNGGRLLVGRCPCTVALIIIVTYAFEVGTG